MATYNPGDIIDSKFRVVRLIGRGGMGEVHEVVHLGLEKSYALKTLLPDAAANAGVAERFLQEGRAAARLRSVHVCIVVDAGTFADGSKYLLMELMHGSSVAQALSNEGPLSVARAADILIEACEALSEAHGVGIVHRDLKPDNLFITRQPDGAELVKVLDFGISKMPTAAVHTSASDVFGTPYYMSPEQLVASRDVDCRSDIWSLGVCLFELLTAHRPWDAEEPIALATKIMTEPPAAIEGLRPDVPVELAAVVRRCLERDAAKRFATARDFARALAPFATDRGRDAFERLDRQPDALGATMPGALASGVASSTSSLGGMSPRTAADSNATPARGASRWRFWALAAGLGAVSAALWLSLGRREAVAPSPLGAATTMASGATTFDASTRDASTSDAGDALRVTTVQGGPVQTLAFSPGANILMIIGGEHTSHVLRRWDVRDSGLFLRETALPQESRGFFASTGEWYATVTTEGNVRLYSTLAGSLAHSFATKDALATVPLPDGGGILAAHADKSVKLWDISRGTPMLLTGLPGTPLAVRTSADGLRAVAGDSKGSVVSLDLRAHRVLCKQTTGTVPISALAMTDDGARLAFADENGRIAILRADDCTLASEATARGAVSRVLFVSGSDALLVAAGKTLELLRGKEASLVRAFRGHDAAITSIAVSRDGALAATGASDGSVMLWKLP